jgi:hypothetical protein
LAKSTNHEMRSAHVFLCRRYLVPISGRKMVSALRIFFFNSVITPPRVSSFKAHTFVMLWVPRDRDRRMSVLLAGS